MKLRTQFLRGYVVVFIIMILVAGYTYLNVTSVIDTQHWVIHTQTVMTKSKLIQRLARHIQSAKRGFQLTGEEALLQPYDEATEEYQREISSLKELVSGEPRQVDRLEEIEAMIRRYQNTVVLRDIEQRRRVTEGTLSMQVVIESVKSSQGSVKAYRPAPGKAGRLRRRGEKHAGRTGEGSRECGPAKHLHVDRGKLAGRGDRDHRHVHQRWYNHEAGRRRAGCDQDNRRKALQTFSAAAHRRRVPWDGDWTGHCAADLQSSQRAHLGTG